VLNKADEVDEQTGKERYESVKAALEGVEEGLEIVVLSGKYGLGLDGLVRILADRVEKARAVDAEIANAAQLAQDKAEDWAAEEMAARRELYAREQERLQTAP
jgi:GTP-binding protein